MDLTVIALIGITLMLVLILLGVNVGISMLFVGFVGYTYVVNFQAGISVLSTNTVTSAMNYAMTVIPLFVLMGQFVFSSGISDDLFNTTRIWFGKRRGGLAYAGVLSCTLFGALCGSLVAATATMSRVATPIMKKHGYKDNIIGGTLACSGTLGCIIPPSTQFILYGIMAEVSIGKLFMAGVLPGIITAICFMIVIAVWCKVDKDVCPPGEAYSMLDKIKSLKGLVLMLLLFTVVLGGMFSGIFSATEAAAAGVIFAFGIMLFRGKLNLKNLKEALKGTVSTTGMVMLSIIGANMFGTFLTVTNLPITIANTIQGLSVPPVVVIALIVIIYGLLGCIMDCMALILLSIPIFMPIITMLGFDPIWFGVVLVMIMNLGAVTPPIGLSCYVCSGVTGIKLSTVFKGCIPFLAAFAVAFIIIIAFPALSTWLPGFIA